jgi:soluble lytic murein transglycosylase
LVVPEASKPVEPRAQIQPLSDPLPPTLNSAADAVALSTQHHRVVGGGHLSVAFAQPIRIEPKEVVS